MNKRIKKGYIGYLVKLSNLINSLIESDPFIHKLVLENYKYKQFC